MSRWCSRPLPISTPQPSRPRANSNSSRPVWTAYPPPSRSSTPTVSRSKRLSSRSARRSISRGWCFTVTRRIQWTMSGCAWWTRAWTRSPTKLAPLPSRICRLGLTWWSFPQSSWSQLGRKRSSPRARRRRSNIRWRRRKRTWTRKAWFAPRASRRKRAACPGPRATPSRWCRTCRAWPVRPLVRGH